MKKNKRKVFIYMLVIVLFLINGYNYGKKALIQYLRESHIQTSKVVDPDHIRPVYDFEM